jgi:F0F1-type ATP synthase membrane subunit a
VVCLGAVLVFAVLLIFVAVECLGHTSFLHRFFCNRFTCFRPWLKPRLLPIDVLEHFATPDWGGLFFFWR